ncbi:alanine--tRNA ligase [Sulfobacillus harzensis]|uniref:Alanine--tRNA ligase n=1 Tax=Sulfobacillus harzensis TaxID=2729629 RepID=A0A7Y0L3N2_9FIRM|nr:alanine--tRNA ligase [Sulfobacillus harzensis]
MQAAVIRQKFLRFFEDHGHQVVPSAPIVPAGDPTLLFTAAGMVQFKDVFLGLEQRSYRRAVSVQKCMRAGGKHNDLDQVGVTARHQTFFEMLGNFSFGDYFKEEAIRLAWGFLLGELGLSPDVLWVTVFETDDEAYQLWQEVAGVSPDRIVRLGAHDNFWAMGDTGPCGPCSEIYVDRGPEHACGPHCGLGQCECDRFTEIWNLVFMQYDRDAEGELMPLPRPSIDTGMGLDRVAAYMQGVDSNFETDLFRPIIAAIEKLSGASYAPGPEGMPFRVIADHIRAITFLLAEGVSFSNEGRGYVMRRILRRAMRFGMMLGFEEPFLYQLVPQVGRVMGEAYPEVVNGEDSIQALVQQEEQRFLSTLSAGLRVLEQKLEEIPAGGVLSGADAFQLYDTFGFPLDLTRDAALERGIGVDEAAFDQLMAEQRERARQNRARMAELLPEQAASEFLGYETLVLNDEPLQALYVERDPVTRLEAGMSGIVYLARTPFYPEGGGQVGDVGLMTSETGKARVVDTVKSGSAIYHLVEVDEGFLAQGQPTYLRVDEDRRHGAMRNHTGTHLLHAALRDVLGQEVHQTGSLVAPDRLRFDFAYPKALTAEQIEAIEDLVNRWVLADIPVSIDFLSKDEALKRGALAFFGDKYGETVRVITVPGASQELCGGTHCSRTGQIGLFAIVEEASVGGGSRRIEAVTGMNALRAFRRQRQVIGDLQQVMVGTPEPELVSRVAALQEEVKRLDALRQETERRERAKLGRDLADQVAPVGPVKFLVAEVDADSPEALREVLDGAKTVVDGAILAARHGERASLLVYFGDQIRLQGHQARQLVKPLSQIIGGGGGGRDDLAQAGGKKPDAIPALLQEARQWVDKTFGMAG